MLNESQGNESQAHVIIRNNDGDTIHNVKRTVRNIKNDGISKTGQATIKGKTFNLIADGWDWIGQT